MPQGLPGFFEPEGRIYGRAGELYRSQTSLYLKTSSDTLNVGWTYVTGSLIFTTPTPTPTATPTATPVPTPTPTPTATSVGPTLTPTETPTPTPTLTPTATLPAFLGLYGTYFSNDSFGGTNFYNNPTATSIDFYYATPAGPPAVPNPNSWSARFSGSIYVTTSDTYDFVHESDDRGNLFIDGTEKISENVSITASLNNSLSAGWHSFEFRYRQLFVGQASSHVKWKKSSEPNGAYSVITQFGNPYGPIAPVATPTPTPTPVGPTPTPTPTATSIAPTPTPVPLCDSYSVSAQQTCSGGCYPVTYGAEIHYINCAGSSQSAGCGYTVPGGGTYCTGLTICVLSGTTPSVVIGSISLLGTCS